MNEVRYQGVKVAKSEYDRQRMRSKITRYPSDGSSTATTPEYAYDEQNRLTGIEHEDSGAARITSYEYGYDELGNISQVVNISGGSTLKIGSDLRGS